jgi:nucleoside recognition membrane protein YjiH
MTEFELMEIMGSFASVIHAWVTTYFTTLTAYIIAAYIVGANLTLFQVVTINVGFTWFCGLCAYGGLGAGMRCAQLGREIMALNASRDIALTENIVNSAAFVMFGGIFIALIFMWQIRHPKTE